ncbi:MAG: hypothetical protein C4K49_05635 [Candidatus Thorarchaeota archaeon]|nr:MAG: hypothetical protein C4K49_05635 [Candidatus Thorarchaeota archaeon]
MSLERWTKAVLLVVVFATLMPFYCPIGQARVHHDLPANTGPFVDEIVYNVISSDDQQVLALVNNEIDIIGDVVDATYLQQLKATENTEVTFQPP